MIEFEAFFTARRLGFAYTCGVLEDGLFKHMHGVQ